MPIIGYNSALLPLAYNGPGDVITGASPIAWWGIRAYSLAKAGTKCINLRRDSDNATRDFSTIINGNLDVASILTWKGTANVFATKLYDQVGSNDVAQATAAAQPQLNFNVLGSLPGLYFLSANSQFLVSNNSITQNFPFSVSNVHYTDTAGAGRFTMFGDTATTLQMGTDLITGPSLFTYASGTQVEITTPHQRWHTFHGIFDNSTGNADSYIDGVSNTFNLASPLSGLSSTADMGAIGGNQQFMIGYIQELGIWGSALDISQRYALNVNQRSYWKF